jgi:photosystem II stability/assembly factor-like uncharacterized protein
MSDGEDELRRRLQDPRWGLPAWDDAEGRIRRAARRDRRFRVTGIVAVTVVLLAGALAGVGLSRRPRQVNVVAPNPTAAPAVTITASPTPRAATSTSSSSPSPASSANGAAGPIPAGFSAASVSFVSLQTGWVLGSSCTTCTAALLRTEDGGKSWARIPAPPVSLPAGLHGAGVGRVRFAGVNDGWVFGPDLWATHDGGAHWERPAIPGLAASSELSDLEAAGGMVHAVFLGNGAVQIETSPVGRDAWRLSPATLQIGGGPIPDARIVLHGNEGWIVENDRVVVAGARLGHGTWEPRQPPCLGAGGPAALAASTNTNLVAVCEEGLFTGTTVSVRAYFSADGGTTFRQPGVQVPFDSVDSVATTLPATTVLGVLTSDSTPELAATFDGGSHWTVVHRGPAHARWNDLGFTSPDQGVVIETAPGALTGSLLMTFDGGHSWRQMPFQPAGPAATRP